MGAPPLSLRAIIYPERSEWVAHCLDLDIVETGESVELAMSALAEAVGTQLWYAREHDNFLDLFHPAPREAWQRFGAILSGPHRILVHAVDDRKQEFTLQSLLAA